MTIKPAAHWKGLEPNDLPVLSAVASLPNLDPHLIWWDVTRGRSFTPAGQGAALPVLVHDKAGYRFDFVAPGPSLLKLLTDEGAQVQLGLAAVPDPGAPPFFDIEGSPGAVLFGVIDDGCAFLNRCLCTADGTASRVGWLWDQDDQQVLPSDPDWRRDSRFSYGRHLRTEGFLRAWQTAQQAGEEAAYSDLRYLCDASGKLLSRSHGTHITSLATGRIVTLFPGGISSGVPDAASDAQIAVVKLPAASIEDTSGRSLCVHVLSGIQYIMSKASSCKAVVINLSLGTHGGPHDESSLLARAIADEVARHEGRLVVVTGAGNGFEEPMHAHADGALMLKPRQTCRLRWEVAPDDPTDTFLELWHEGSLEVQLETPDGQASAWVALGQRQLRLDAGTVVACVSNTDSPPNGRGALIHLALAPTRSGDALPVPPYGTWILHIRNAGREPAGFDCWIDRDDAPYGAKLGQRYPSRLRDEPGAGVRFCSDQRTINGLASARSMLIAAAATLTTQQPSRYSASGDGRGGFSIGPFVALPADESPMLPGMPGAGVLSSQLQRLGGTSVATALLSREVINILARLGPIPASLQALKAVLGAALFPGGSGPPPDPLRTGLGCADSSIAKLP